MSRVSPPEEGMIMQFMQLIRGFAKCGGVARPVGLRLGAGEVDFYDRGFIAGDEDRADGGIYVGVNHCRLG